MLLTYLAPDGGRFTTTTAVWASLRRWVGRLVAGAAGAQQGNFITSTLHHACVRLAEIEPQREC